MNDFLGSLIARNLTQAETLLPRPVSWFEPRAPDLSPAARARTEPIASQGDPGADRELPWLESVATVLAPPPSASRRPWQRLSQAMAPPPVSPVEGAAQTVETQPAAPAEPAHQPARAPALRPASWRSAGEKPAPDASPGEPPRVLDHAPELTPHQASAAQAPAEPSAAPSPVSPILPIRPEARHALPRRPAPVHPPAQPAEAMPPMDSMASLEMVVPPAPVPISRQARQSSLAPTPRPVDALTVERPAAVSPALLHDTPVHPPALPVQHPTPAEPLDGTADEHKPRAATRPSVEGEAPRPHPVAGQSVLMPQAAAVHRTPAAVQAVVRVAEPASLRPASDGVRGGQQPGPASPETPLTVQVTIGRIEVRAMPAPVAPAASRRAAPAMSLEEYLRQRSQGGRR